MSCQMSERAEANHVIPDFVLSVSIAPGQKCVTNFSRAFPFRAFFSYIRFLSEITL